MSATQMSLFDGIFAEPRAKESMLAHIDHSINRPQVFETESKQDMLYTRRYDHFFARPIPEEGECTHILTNGAFDLTTYVAWMAQQVNLKRVMVSAWSFGFQDTMILQNFCKQGKIKQLDILASDQHPKRHANEHQMFLRMRKDGFVGHYWVAPLHSKLIIAETEDGRFVTVNSAANCTMKAQIEIAEVTGGRELYDFYDSMFSDMGIFEVAETELKSNFNPQQYEEEEEHTVLYGD